LTANDFPQIGNTGHRREIRRNHRSFPKQGKPSVSNLKDGEIGASDEFALLGIGRRTLYRYLDERTD
jgi:hypothetical protein